MSNLKSMHEIVESVKSVETMLLESNGELTPEIEAMLLITETALPEKIDSYGLVIDRFSSLEKFYKEKSDAILRMARAFGSAQDRLKDNLKASMTTLGTDELKGFDIRFKLSATKPSVVVDAVETLDAAYTTIEQVTKVNKDRIRQDLELGVPVNGARLERGFALRSYVNSPAAQKKAVKA